MSDQPAYLRGRGRGRGDKPEQKPQQPTFNAWARGRGRSANRNGTAVVRPGRSPHSSTGFTNELPSSPTAESERLESCMYV